MEQIFKRAFCFIVILFMFVLIVSSATDTNPDSGQGSQDSKGNKPVDSSSENEQQQQPIDNTDAQTKPNITNVSPHKPDATSESAEKKNCSTGSNDTDCEDKRSFVTKFWDNVTENREMLKRTMYVLLGVTGVVIVYFVVRTVKLRRKRSKSRKYGVITSRGDLEMEPLGQGEDDEEDYTVFEMNGRRK